MSQNRGRDGVGRDLKEDLIPAPLPQAGTPSPRLGYSDLTPDWPWTIPAMGHIYSTSGQPAPVLYHTCRK